MNQLKHILRPAALLLALLMLLTILPLPLAPAWAAEEADENGVLDLSDCSPDELLDCIAKADKSRILTVNLMDARGKTKADLETIGKIAAALPDVHIQCSFDLFGKTISSEDERIEYDRAKIGNEGLASIREVLPYLTACNYLLLADCGIDYELLAQLRDDFPEKNVVWRIHIFNGSNSFLTDITLFRTTRVGDADVELLKYCNKVKYIDVGHQHDLTDASFVEAMPDLEVLIIALTGVTDISCLRSCKNLEYLELLTTHISDISPLAELENLQHLNLSNMPYLTDITPLYGLKNLKRLRINTPFDLDKFNIPREQLDTIARLLPNCDMEFGIGNTISNGWRFGYHDDWTERYTLLREQMQYDKF